MRHHNKIKKFGRVRKQRVALMRSLALSLLRHGKIKTTEAKAKAVRPLVERIITIARKEGSAAKRTVQRRLPNKTGVRLAVRAASRYSGRAGGYTRITKTGMRKSDGARMAVIELV